MKKEYFSSRRSFQAPPCRLGGGAALPALARALFPSSWAWSPSGLAYLGCCLPLTQPPCCPWAWAGRGWASSICGPCWTWPYGEGGGVGWAGCIAPTFIPRKSSQLSGLPAVSPPALVSPEARVPDAPPWDVCCKCLHPTVPLLYSKLILLPGVAFIVNNIEMETLA